MADTEDVARAIEKVVKGEEDEVTVEDEKTKTEKTAEAVEEVVRGEEDQVVVEDEKTQTEKEAEAVEKVVKGEEDQVVVEGTSDDGAAEKVREAAAGVKKKTKEGLERLKEAVTPDGRKPEQQRAPEEVRRRLAQEKEQRQRSVPWEGRVEQPEDRPPSEDRESTSIGFQEDLDIEEGPESQVPDTLAAKAFAESVKKAEDVREQVSELTEQEETLRDRTQFVEEQGRNVVTAEQLGQEGKQRYIEVSEGQYVPLSEFNKYGQQLETIGRQKEQLQQAEREILSEPQYMKEFRYTAEKGRDIEGNIITRLGRGTLQEDISKESPVLGTATKLFAPGTKQISQAAQPLRDFEATAMKGAEMLGPLRQPARFSAAAVGGLEEVPKLLTRGVTGIGASYEFASDKTTRSLAAAGLVGMGASTLEYATEKPVTFAGETVGTALLTYSATKAGGKLYGKLTKPKVTDVTVKTKTPARVKGIYTEHPTLTGGGVSRGLYLTQADDVVTVVTKTSPLRRLKSKIPGTKTKRTFTTEYPSTISAQTRTYGSKLYGKGKAAISTGDDLVTRKFGFTGRVERTYSMPKGVNIKQASGQVVQFTDDLTGRTVKPFTTTTTDPTAISFPRSLATRKGITEFMAGRYTRATSATPVKYSVQTPKGGVTTTGSFGKQAASVDTGRGFTYTSKTPKATDYTFGGLYRKVGSKPSAYIASADDTLRFSGTTKSRSVKTGGQQLEAVQVVKKVDDFPSSRLTGTATRQVADDLPGQAGGGTMTRTQVVDEFLKRGGGKGTTMDLTSSLKSSRIEVSGGSRAGGVSMQAGRQTLRDLARTTTETTRQTGSVAAAGLETPESQQMTMPTTQQTTTQVQDRQQATLVKREEKTASRETTVFDRGTGKITGPVVGTMPSVSMGMDQKRQEVTMAGKEQLTGRRKGLADDVTPKADIRPGIESGTFRTRTPALGIKIRQKQALKTKQRTAAQATGVSTAIPKTVTSTATTKLSPDFGTGFKLPDFEGREKKRKERGITRKPLADWIGATKTEMKFRKAVTPAGEEKGLFGTLPTLQEKKGLLEDNRKRKII